MKFSRVRAPPPLSGPSPSTSPIPLTQRSIASPLRNNANYHHLLQQQQQQLQQQPQQVQQQQQSWLLQQLRGCNTIMVLLCLLTLFVVVLIVMEANLGMLYYSQDVARRRLQECPVELNGNRTEPLPASQRVAICVHGDPLYLDLTGRSIMDFVVDAFDPSHTDLFVAAINNEHAHKLTVFQRAELAAARLWPPRFVPRKDVERLREVLTEGGEGSECVPGEGRGGVYEEKSGGMHGESSDGEEVEETVEHYFLVEDCLRLVDAHERRMSLRYSWLIYISTDQLWSGLPPHLPLLQTDKLTVPFYGPTGGYSSRAGICHRHIADKALPRLSTMRRLASKGARAGSSGRAFKLALQQQGIDVGFAHFPFCRLTHGRPSSSASEEVGAASSGFGEGRSSSREEGRRGSVRAPVVGLSSSVGAINGMRCEPCEPVATGDGAWMHMQELPPGWGFGLYPSAASQQQGQQLMGQQYPGMLLLAGSLPGAAAAVAGTGICPPISSRRSWWENLEDSLSASSSSSTSPEEVPHDSSSSSSFPSSTSDALQEGTSHSDPSAPSSSRQSAGSHGDSSEDSRPTVGHQGSTGLQLCDERQEQWGQRWGLLFDRASSRGAGLGASVVRRKLATRSLDGCIEEMKWLIVRAGSWEGPSSAYVCGLARMGPLVHVGPEYGGWMMFRDQVENGSLVYSFGVGTDVSWDVAMIAQFNATVYAFDNTPVSMRWVRAQVHLTPESGWHHLAYLLGAEDKDVQMAMPVGHGVSYTRVDVDNLELNREVQQVTLPARQMETVLGLLGHKRVSVIKIDVEGAEFEVFTSWKKRKFAPKACQLLVEFHGQYFKDGVERRRKAVEDLEALGFYLAYSSLDAFGADDCTFFSVRNCPHI